VSPAEKQRLMIMNDQDFKQALGLAFSHRLGDIQEVSQRFVFPLFKQQATRYVTTRVALVGDAAHTVHPLAGQGVNIGLLDAASLAQVIAESGFKRLRRYERWRRADNVSMLAGVDMLKKLFASEKPSILGLRSLGLNIVNSMPWLKNIFTRHAVGDRDGLPRIARP